MRAVSCRGKIGEAWLVCLSLSVHPFKIAVATCSADDLPAGVQEEERAPLSPKNESAAINFAELKKSAERIPLLLGNGQFWHFWRNPYARLRRNGAKEPDNFSAKRTVVQLDNVEVESLIKLCISPTWTPIAKDKRAREISGRQEFLESILRKLNVVEGFTNVTLVAKLRSGNCRVVEVVRRLQRSNECEESFQLLYLDAGEHSCAQIQPNEVVETEEGPRQRQGWTSEEMNSLIVKVLGRETGHVEEKWFFHTLTRDGAALAFLQDAFQGVGKSIWRIFPKDKMKFKLKKIDLRDIDPPYEVGALQIDTRHIGKSDHDWQRTFEILRARAPSPPSVVDLTHLDFFGEDYLSCALLCNALITAETSLDTHLIHVTRDGQVNHALWSVAGGVDGRVAQILLYEEEHGRISQARRTSAADSPHSSIQAQWIIDELLSYVKVQKLRSSRDDYQ